MDDDWFNAMCALALLGFAWACTVLALAHHDIALWRIGMGAAVLGILVRALWIFRTRH